MTLRVSKKLLKKIYKDAPIPVYERRMSKFFGKYNGNSQSPHILISSDMRNYQKLATFYHELGHYLCANLDCKCQKSDIVNEAHAIIFGIRECRNLGFTASCKWSIQSVLDIAHSSDRYNKVSYLAAKTVLKYKEFDKHLSCLM